MRPLWRKIDLLRVCLLLHIETIASVATGLFGRFFPSYIWSARTLVWPEQGKQSGM